MTPYTMKSDKSRSLKALRMLAVGALTGVALVFAPAPAMAAPEPGGVVLKMEQLEEVVVVDKNGKQEKKIQALTRAAPGKEILYVVTYSNQGKKPAEQVVINNPVPAGLLYQVGSLQGAGTRSDVSVDGGKTFGDLAKLTVPDADGKPRPAKAEDVTTVRWTVLAPVKPGGEGKVSFRAWVK